MKFNSLKINQKILDAIKEAKYDEMTEIQENVIPLILKNNDVLAQAPTGTGKTATFVIPTIEKIDTSISTQVIVISPTRELAIQIDNEYKKIGSLLNGFKTVCLYGGQKIDFQLR
jgi:ATP-dependent RNA helicase DeaD